MNNEIKIQLVIVDQALEEKVIHILQCADVEISGRYLALSEVPKVPQEKAILLTTSHLVQHVPLVELQREFLGLIVLGDVRISGMTTVTLTEIEQLPNVIANAIAQAAPDVLPSRIYAPGFHIVGVAPRVGVRVLRDAIDTALPDSNYLLRKKSSQESTILYCSELDDDSILQLLAIVAEDKGIFKQQAVVFTKVPETRLATERVKVIERELQGFGISLVCALPFDKEVQILGELSKAGLRALQPLFDWIAKAN